MLKLERVWFFSVLVMILGTHAVQAELPPHIMKTAQWSDRSSLPHDGWAVFLARGTRRRPAALDSAPTRATAH